MDKKPRYKPVVLMILDGFGISPEQNKTACVEDGCSVFFEMEKFFPFTTLQASGIAVGLPWGEAGNSEVGHLAIGAGKILLNYLPKISTSISDSSFFKNEALLKAVEHINATGGNLHISGLFSSGTVHSYSEHLYALLDFAKQNNIKKTFLHLYTDGKDAKKKEGADFYKKFEEISQKEYPEIKIATIIGRGYSMVRDGNWEKTKITYEVFTKGSENKFNSVSDYVAEQYKKEITDDGIPPAINANLAGEGRIKDNDALIFFNFREDSMRQLSSSFIQKEFTHFQRNPSLPKNLLVVTMTEYDKTFTCLNAFESAKIQTPLAKVVSENGFTQLHIAETEKYAHITYFLNGGQEIPFNKEDRILVPSPETTSYDLTPEMSCSKVADAVLDNLKKYDFIAVNFANADMVGHTGNLNATLEAIKNINTQIGRILPKILEIGGILLITADHGNAEEKIYRITGEKRTKHSINPVPVYIIGNDFKNESPLSPEKVTETYKRTRGALSDVAPTILDLLGLVPPPDMRGESLLTKFPPHTKNTPVVMSKKFGILSSLIGFFRKE